MSYFKRARNHKKSYSKTLDEKIAKAYKEFEKTGVSDVILESPSNSTAGVYYAGKEIPEVPAVFTDVPDPNGVTSSGWTQPTNGFNANDPSTWENAYTDTSWLYNSNEVFGQTGRPVVDSVPTTWQGATQGAGIMTAHVGWGQSLGYLDNNGIYRPLVTAGMMGSTMIPPSARGSHFDGAHYTYAIPDDRWAAMQGIYAKYQEMAASGNVVAQQIKVWYGTSYFFDGPWENIGGVKRESDYHKLINATIFKRAGNYESEPVIPAYTQVIFKDEIGRAQNLNMSGFQKALNGLFGLGNNALQSLTNRIIYGKGGPTGGFAADPKYTKEKIQQIANNISDPEKKADFEKKMADLTSTIEKTAQVQKEAETEAKNIAAKFGLDVALTIFGGAILKGAGAAASKIPGVSSIVSNATTTGGAIVGKVANLLKLTGKVDDAAALATATKAVNTATKAEQAAKASNALSAIGGTFDDVDDIVAVVGSAKYQAAMTQAKLAGSTTSSSASNAAFNAIETAIQSGSDDAMKAAVKNANSKVLGAASSSTSSGSIVSKINLKPQFKGGGQSFDLGGDWADIGISQFKSILTNPQKFGIKPGSKQWSRISKYAQDYLVQSYESQGQVLTEKNHLRARREEKRELVEKKFSGKVAKVNIPGPNDHLTVKAIDMLRQYKVSEEEMQEYAAIIGDINQWIRENPKEYEIWKVRYPANDPRLAELNWRTDQQLRASEEYIESRFPQNQKLYKKLKKKIEININATDPTRFKNERAEIVYKKLLSVSRAIKLDTLAPVKKLKEHKIKYKLAEGNKSDWKEDFYIWPSYLCEGMTTGSLFNMALNPTGSEPVEINDVSLGHHDFAFEPGGDATPVDPADIGANYEYQIDGTGTDIGGFDGKYLVMSGGSRQSSSYVSTQYFMALDDFDASKSDSITFTIKAGDNANGGMKPAGPLYAAMVNSAHMNSEEHGYGILGLPNPDCHVYDPSQPDFKPLFDGTDTIINYASSGLPYAGHGIPAHQTGEDVTITLDIPEDWRLPNTQIYFSSQHGHYDSNITGNFVHHQHLSKQTLPVPGLDGRTIDDLWGHDFTWNLSNYLSNKLYPSDGWQDLNSNGDTHLRSMGWFFWHNIQASKHPNWPIGTDATAYGQYGGYQSGQYYYGNGDPLPISGATQTDHHSNSNPPTDADYEAVAQMILDKFRRSPVYGIKNVQTSRRLPMNVMVGLDDPAASAFIRIGSGPQEGKTSPKKRKKRVETILKASKEYTDKYVAPDLPGSNATFGDVQASPTGYGEVQDKFADVKDSDIPGNLNTAATPDTPNAAFVDSPKPSLDNWNAAAAVNDVEKQKTEIKKVIDQKTPTEIKTALTTLEKSNGFQKLGTAGKVYVNYLTGGIKNGTINNKFLGQKYVNSAFSSAYINDNGTVTVGDNVIGSGGNATYDPKTGIVTIPFNYDFDTNEQQIMKNPDKYDVKKGPLTAAGMVSAWIIGGKYGLDSVPVPGAGYATWLSKTLGGAKGTTGHKITMNISDLAKSNPNFLTQLHHNGDISLAEYNKATGFNSTESEMKDQYNTINETNKQWEREKEEVRVYNERIMMQHHRTMSGVKWDSERKMGVPDLDNIPPGSDLDISNKLNEKYIKNGVLTISQEEYARLHGEMGGYANEKERARLEALIKEEPIQPNPNTPVEDMVDTDKQIDELVNKVSNGEELTDLEKQVLIDAGYDDFVKGGDVKHGLPDMLAQLGLSWAAVKYLIPLLIKAGGKIIDLIKYEWGQRAITDAAWKTFQATGKMPPWYHWAAWKLLPQPVLNVLGKMTGGKLYSTSLQATKGTLAGTIGLNSMLGIAAFVTGNEAKGISMIKDAFAEKTTSYIDSLSVEDAEDQAWSLFSEEDADQDKLMGIFDEVYESNEGFKRANEESQAIRDGVKTAQDEYNEAASAWSNAFADNKYTGTKGWLNLPDEQRFEKADMSGDYQTYAADKAFVEKWKADAKKGANVYEIGYNYAEKQPAFKQSRKAYDDHEKVLDKLSSDRAAAYEAVTSFLGGLGPHPSPELARKGYLDCDIECMQKKIKLENAAKEASAKEDEGQKKRESLWSSHISTRNSLRDEYVDRNMNQMNLSIKASDTIRTKIKDMKKVYDEKKKIADELRKTEKERLKAIYDSDWYKEAQERLAKDFLKKHNVNKFDEIMNSDLGDEVAVPDKYKGDGFDDFLESYKGLGDISQIPGYVLDSIKRQYKGGKDYTIEDKKNIINWQQKIRAGLDNDTEIAASPDPGPAPVKPGEVPTVPSSPWLPGKSPATIAASPDPGPAPVKPGDVPVVPSSPWLPGKSPAKLAKLAKRKKDLGSTIADVSQGLSATDAASIAGSQTTSKGTKKKKKYNTKTVVASFKPQGGTLKETTFEKIRKLRKNWDYEGKPTPTETGFPEKEPPERVNGWHPEYGKGHEKRYKKLDPHSAKTMARVKTGDPKVDNIVKKQAKG